MYHVPIVITLLVHIDLVHDWYMLVHTPPRSGYVGMYQWYISLVHREC